MAGKTYIVEHLDDELGPWSELEYITIAKESHQAGSKFCLSSVPASLELPQALQAVPGFTADGRSVETLYASDKSRVCLLDPSATKELSPEDGQTFDVFLFGGILGRLHSMCLSILQSADPAKETTPLEVRSCSLFLVPQSLVLC